MMDMPAFLAVRQQMDDKADRLYVKGFQRTMLEFDSRVRTVCSLDIRWEIVCFFSCLSLARITLRKRNGCYFATLDIESTRGLSCFHALSSRFLRYFICSFKASFPFAISMLPLTHTHTHTYIHTSSVCFPVSGRHARHFHERSCSCCQCRY